MSYYEYYLVKGSSKYCFFFFLKYFMSLKKCTQKSHLKPTSAQSFLDHKELTVYFVLIPIKLLYFELVMRKEIVVFICHPQMNPS